MAVRLGAAKLLLAWLVCTLLPTAPGGARSALPLLEDYVDLKTENETRTPNRLIHESSPYLLQHADNPVDWYAWGEEAFARARKENKPIFLSIGYSACHWCHVMERESFENAEIATVLNEFFVSIKVDREERPDLDEIYMTAVQLMTGSGGWPLTVFLTPDLEPFYGGTYFPPEDMFGRAGFLTILNAVHTAWETTRGDLVRNAGKLADVIRRNAADSAVESGALSPQLLHKAAEALGHAFDPNEGGFGPAPKFPQSAAIALLLRHYVHTRDAQWRDMATLTLDKMALGGMYDQLGGGFHRYSTDARWLVPHFEKMLYDNAQLAQAYVDAYQLTHKPLYRKVAAETLDYVLRDMADEAGAFHSSEDADSEGEEGTFYLWRYDEIEAVLGAEDAAMFCAYYGVNSEGNFRSPEPYHTGRNILHVPRAASDVAQELGLSVDELEEKVKGLRAKLLVERDRRVRPHRDDKVLTSWNALMISALARGFQALGDERYRTAAENAADFILTHMMKDGALLRTHRNGVSHLPGYLDDYAFLTVALIDLYEATFDLRWITAADDLAGTMIGLFWDQEDGGFYFTAEHHTDLIARTKPTYDGAEPSGNAMAAIALLRLAKLTDTPDYHDKARRIFENNHVVMGRAPRNFLAMLCAVGSFLQPHKEIAIVGVPGSAEVEGLLRALHARFIPNRIIALLDTSDGVAARARAAIPLLKGKELVSGKAAAYVCKDFTCSRPATTPDEFIEALEGEAASP